MGAAVARAVFGLHQNGSEMGRYRRVYRTCRIMLIDASSSLVNTGTVDPRGLRVNVAYQTKYRLCVTVAAHLIKAWVLHPNGGFKWKPHVEDGRRWREDFW